MSIFLSKQEKTNRAKCNAEYTELANSIYDQEYPQADEWGPVPAVLAIIFSIIAIYAGVLWFVDGPSQPVQQADYFQRVAETCAQQGEK